MLIKKVPWQARFLLARKDKTGTVAETPSDKNVLARKKKDWA